MYVIRHGTRKAGGGSIQKLKVMLPPLREIILNSYKNGNSKLSKSTIEKFENWTGFSPDEDVQSKEMHPEGIREMVEIGKRMRVRFPKLFSKKTNATYKVIFFLFKTYLT